MPVDPNEPTYCVCQQVSYGEMIGCDNTEVCREEKRSALILKMKQISFLISITSVTVPYRVVSFCLCRIDHKAKRQMVLSEVQSGQKEKINRKSKQTM